MVADFTKTLYARMRPVGHFVTRGGVVEICEAFGHAPRKYPGDADRTAASASAADGLQCE